MTDRRKDPSTRGRHIGRALGLLVLTAALSLAGCATGDETEVVLTIRPGSSFREAADSLAAHGVVRFPRLFGFYAARRGRDRSTRYGMYVIRRGASWNGILHALQTGEGIMNRVTIPEGWPLWETLPVLARTLDLSLDSLEAAVRDPALLARLGIPRRVETAEGYLFPDTYDFPKGATAREAVELMVRRFEARWDPAWDARLADFAKGPVDTTDRGEYLDLLDGLYRTQTGQKPDELLEPLEAPDPKTGEKPSREALREASIAALEGKLRSTIEVTDKDLEDLARARAKAVQEALLGSGEVDPLRVFLRAPAGIAPTANSVRLKLELKQ